MLSKQLLFRLAIILFMVSVVGLLIFKVDTLSVNVTKSSIQARMEPVFFIDGKSSETNIKYEITDPIVKVLDSGDILIKSHIMVESGLNQKWGNMEFVTKVAFQEKNNSFYLKIPGKVQLKFRGKSSNDIDFKLWGKNVEPLLATITEQLNSFLFTKDIFALSGSELRVQAISLAIRDVQKTEDGIKIILDVDQGIFVIIVYFNMLLAAFIFACGYFFVGGVVGFKDPTKMLFVDPRKIPKKREK